MGAIQPAGRVQRRHGAFVILRVKGCFPDVVVRLCGDRALGKFLEQLLECLGHFWLTILFAQEQGLLLKGRFAFLGRGIIADKEI